MRKARQKGIDAEDEILMMGYLLMKREMEKRRNHRQLKQWVREMFLQRESHEVYNILWKELRLKYRGSFFR